MSRESILEAARVIESLFSALPTTAGQAARRITRQERQEQAVRVKRFLVLPPELQEGILRYGENIQKAYKA